MDDRTSPSLAWDVSHDGVGNWVTLRLSPFSLKNAAGVGQFDHAPGDDVLYWHWGGLGGSFGNYVDIYSVASRIPCATAATTCVDAGFVQKRHRARTMAR